MSCDKNYIVTHYFHHPYKILYFFLQSQSISIVHCLHGGYKISDKKIYRKFVCSGKTYFIPAVWNSCGSCISKIQYILESVPIEFD